MFCISCETAYNVVSHTNVKFSELGQFVIGGIDVEGTVKKVHRFQISRGERLCTIWFSYTEHIWLVFPQTLFDYTNTDTPSAEILSCYISPSSRCLEMFARNLTPHWTSWGNEVRSYQIVIGGQFKIVRRQLC